MTANRANGAVLSAGRVYTDLVFAGAPRMPSLGTEVFADTLQVHAGGGAFITSAYLCALNRQAELAANLAFGPMASKALPQISDFGVGMSLSTRYPGDDMQMTVAITGRDDRAFLTHRAGQGATVPDASDVRKKNICHLHIGELNTLAEHPALLMLAADCGLTVSLDCAWNDDLPEGIAQLASQVDVFLPNAAEMARLQETGFDLSSVPLAVVKQGAHGATAHRRGAEPVSVPARYADVVDPTGAGDAFNAGFLDGWLKGWPLGDCLAQGNMCGAAAVECMGGATAARVVGAQAEAPRQRQVQQ